MQSVNWALTACSPPFLLRSSSINPKQARSQKVAVKRGGTRARRVLPSRLVPILLAVLVLISCPTCSFRTKKCYFERETKEKRTSSSLASI